MDDPKFQPSPGMRRLLAAVLRDDGASSMEERCQAARINPQTYQKWLADSEGFGRWINREIGAYVRSRLWEVRLRHLRAALSQKENLQAVKLFYDSFGDGAVQTADRAGDSPSDLASFLKLNELTAPIEHDRECDPQNEEADLSIAPVAD